MHIVRRLIGYLWWAVRGALTILLALALVFEEWGWRPLARILAIIASWGPLATIEAWLARLPPYGALAAFGLPAVLLLPAKLAALWFLAEGHAILAVCVLIAAKVVGTALVARIWQVTSPQLMRIGWFARACQVLLPWKDALLARIRASWPWRWGRIVKFRAKRQAKAIWSRIKALLAAKSS